jgi:drug/metabolite transporter (DMT)-like permease
MARLSVNPSTLGIVLMTCAMLSIPLVDGLAKHLSGTYSPLFLAWARFAVASLIVLPLAAARDGPAVFPSERRMSHVLRTVCAIIAMTLYFLAIAQTPLATAISAFFIGPIVAVALSLIILCRDRSGNIARPRLGRLLRILSGRHPPCGAGE